MATGQTSIKSRLPLHSTPYVPSKTTQSIDLTHSEDKKPVIDLTEEDEDTEPAKDRTEVDKDKSESVQKSRDASVSDLSAGNEEDALKTPPASVRSYPQ